MKKDEYTCCNNVVINCTQKNFGGYPKMGDSIAVLNIFQYIRDINNNPNIKFYLPDDEMYGYDYVLQFKRFLEKRTDFFSNIKGEYDMIGSYELWSFREHNGELVKINNPEPQQKKVCVFPLLDANYDNQRNWPEKVLRDVIQKFSKTDYDDYEKILCIKDDHLLTEIDTKKFQISTNFDDNINHILTCEYYVGGATGLSLFASVLSNLNRKIECYYHKGLHGTWRSEFTAPFYMTGKNRTMNYYSLTQND